MNVGMAKEWRLEMLIQNLGWQLCGYSYFSRDDVIDFYKSILEYYPNTKFRLASRAIPNWNPVEDLT